MTLRALADAMRREILDGLRRGPRPVGEIAATLPVSRPAVSQHLRVLQDAGLVVQRRRGTRRLYSVEPRGLVELRGYLDSLWGDALAAFGDEPSERTRSRPAVRRNLRRT